MSNNVSSTNLTGLYGSSGNNVTVVTSNVLPVDNTIASKNLTTLYSSQGQPTIIPSNGGGTTNISILDEGILITPNVASMNFVGSGVVANATGNAVTITVSSSNIFDSGISLLNNSNIDLLSAGVGSPVGISNVNVDFLIVNGDMGVYPKSTGAFFVDASSGGGASFIANTKFNEAVGGGGAGKTLELGNVAQLKIIGGTNGQVLTTDGSTNLSWQSVTVANANFANYAGNVTVSAQPNITSVGNLIYLNVKDDSNVLGVVNQFLPNSTNVAPLFTSNSAYQVTTQYHPNNSTNYPMSAVIRSRGNSTSPTTISQNDRIAAERFLAFNGNANVLSGGVTWTAVNGTTINNASNQAFVGGQWNLFTGNPNGNLANATGLDNQNALIFTNSGSLQINPGGPANSSLGQAGSPIIITNYGLSTTDLVSTGGINQQRARGNRDGLLSVQPSDNLGRWNSWGYNGSAYTSSNVASITMYVDGSYVANSAIIPMNISFTSRSNTGASVQRQFYGNGLSTFPGDITTTGLANVGSLTVTGTGNIANLVLTKYNENVAASVNTGTSISPNVAASTIFNFTANNNFTFNGLTSAVAGSSATVIITQDATGSRIMTTTMLFASGSNTLSTAASAKDVISVFYDGTTYFASLTKAYA